MLLFIPSCGKYHGLDYVKQVHEEKKHLLEELKASFAKEENEISTMSWGTNGQDIQIRTVDGKFYKLKNYYDQIQNKELIDRQVELFKQLDIKLLVGYKTGVVIAFNKTGGCLDFVGSDIFDPNTEYNKRKIQNYQSGAKTDWIYVIDEKWYVRTECD